VEEDEHLTACVTLLRVVHPQASPEAGGCEARLLDGLRQWLPLEELFLLSSSILPALIQLGN
jgi:hypothetical protein